LVQALQIKLSFKQFLVVPDVICDGLDKFLRKALANIHGDEKLKWIDSISHGHKIFDNSKDYTLNAVLNQLVHGGRRRG
jgi:hypothetical protein